MNVCFIFTEETSEHRMGSNSEVSWNMHHRRFQENKTPCVESEIFHSMVENTSTNHVQMWTAWAGSKCVTSKKNICFEFMFWVYDKSRIFLFCFEYTFPPLLYSFMVLCDTWLGVFVEHFAFDWRFSFNFIPLLHEWNWKQIAFSTMEAYRFTGCHKTQVLCLALRFLTVCIPTQNLPEVKDNISLVLGSLFTPIYQNIVWFPQALFHKFGCSRTPESWKCAQKVLLGTYSTELLSQWLGNSTSVAG